MEGPNLSVAQRLGYGIAFVGGRLAWSKFTVRSHWYSGSRRRWCVCLLAYMHRYTGCTLGRQTSFVRLTKRLCVMVGDLTTCGH